DGVPSVFNILKLGHVAYRVLDVQQIVKFYSEVLGFRVSDWRGDFFVFLRCNTDHPTLNFIIDEKPQLHHIAFAVIDWCEIHKSIDHLAHNNVHLVWGPGRHVIGHNVATYHRNADLVRVEIFCEMDQMKDEDLGYFDPRPWHQEFPLYPKMHGPETLRNYWGFGSERVIQGYQTNEIPQYGAIRGRGLGATRAATVLCLRPGVAALETRGEFGQPIGRHLDQDRLHGFVESGDDQNPDRDKHGAHDRLAGLSGREQARAPMRHRLA